jgi:hypothetical protein
MDANGMEPVVPNQVPVQGQEEIDRENLSCEATKLDKYMSHIHRIATTFDERHPLWQPDVIGLSIVYLTEGRQAMCNFVDLVHAHLDAYPEQLCLCAPAIAAVYQRIDPCLDVCDRMLARLNDGSHVSLLSYVFRDVPETQKVRDFVHAADAGHTIAMDIVQRGIAVGVRLLVQETDRGECFVVYADALCVGRVVDELCKTLVAVAAAGAVQHHITCTKK